MDTEVGRTEEQDLEQLFSKEKGSDQGRKYCWCEEAELRKHRLLKGTDLNKGSLQDLKWRKDPEWTRSTHPSRSAGRGWERASSADRLPCRKRPGRLGQSRGLRSAPLRPKWAPTAPLLPRASLL